MKRNLVANKRFVLIDQSIAGLAGHHYEYAVHVLRAAEKAGYEPILATNRAFAASNEKLPWRTIPVYRHGYWASAAPAGFQFWPGAIQLASWLRFHFRFQKRYSLAGFLWSIRNDLTGFIGVQVLHRGSPLQVLPLAVLAIAFKTLRFLAVLLALPFALLVFLWRLAERILRFGRFPKAYKESLLADPKDLATFIRKLHEQRHVWLEWLQRLRLRRDFLEDTSALLRQTGVRPGDLFFVPTISATEMLGLADLLPTAGGAWRLLFRRDLYPGRNALGPGRDHPTKLIEQAFHEAAAKARGANLRFYTDSEELSRQYNQLRLFPFETLPIPHTHPSAAAGPRSGPLRVLYLGDARTEKGYHYIPGLIENVWDDYVATGRVEFHLQSNFNIPQGEPHAVIARHRLEQLAAKAAGAIRLYTAPLTSEQYRDLLLSGDINLLLYDPANYYARSSGILVESLSAGIPVIAPAATWLTRQFREPAAAWRRRLPGQMQVLRERSGADLRWRLGGPGEANPFSAAGLPVSSAPATCRMRVPAGAARLLIQIEECEPARLDLRLETDIRDAANASIRGAAAHILEAEAGTAVAVLPLHRMAARIRLSFAAASGGVAGRVGKIHLLFLAPEASHPVPPASVIGAAYDHPDDIEAHFRELVEHHDHYRSTARQFAGNWRQRHNAEALVAILQAQAPARAAEANA